MIKPSFREINGTRNMIYKQHREIETILSLVLCCLFSYSKISKRLEGVAYKLLLINHTARKKSRNGGGELRTFHCHLTRGGPFIFILYISSTRLPLFNSTLSELEGVETFTGEF